MFKEILQIVPKLSAGELDTMEKQLAGRFTRIAKNFGRGLAGILTGGTVIAAAAALLQKALSPLKEVQEAIDRTLDKGSQLSVQAKQFGSTPGELAKLQAIAQAKGVGPDELGTLLTRFQEAIAQAVADPTKNTSVRAFVGQKDTAAAFFEFIQSLQKLPQIQQVAVQSEVFGAKQLLRMSEFLNADFPALVKAFGDIDTSRLTQNIQKLDKVGGLQKQLQAHTELADIGNKAKVINSSQVVAMDQAEQTRLARENKRIADFQGLISIDQKMQSIQDNLEQLTRQILLGIPFLTDSLNKLIDLMKLSVDGWKQIFALFKDSRIMKGILRLTGEK